MNILNRPTVLSLFSGVGGFDLGLEQAGMETVFQCEIDARCRSVLRRHWANVPQWDDVTTLTGAEVLRHAPRIDVVAWGSPCQDLSKAGKGAGLVGERSGLFFEGMRIIKEIRKETNGQYPRITIWENVAGAFSSNKGADFGRILDEMAEAGAVVIEWRLLDAQFFGVAQRRKRVFIVAVFDSATAERCSNPLLPVSEGLRGDSSSGRKTRQGVATTIDVGVGIGDSQEQLNLVEIVGALCHRDYKGVGNQYVDEGKLIVEDVDRTVADTTGPLTTHMASPRGSETTDSNFVIIEQMVFADDRRSGPRIFGEVCETLQAFMGTGGNNTPMVAYPIQDGRDMEKNQNGIGIAEAGSPSYTLDQTGAQSVAYDAIAFDGFNQSVNQVSQTIRADKSDADHVGMVFQESIMAVRRLTPLECERLMGWDDGWTQFDCDGNEIADTHRYRMCGNGVVAPVAKWVGEQLVPFLQ